MPLVAAEVLFTKNINKEVEVLFITQLPHTTHACTYTLRSKNWT